MDDSAYAYSAGRLEAIGPTLAGLVRQQTRRDAVNALTVPRLFGEKEVILESGGVKEILIGTDLARTRTATVFSVRGDANRVVKYFHNCFDLNDVHPLLRDYLFLQRLNGTGVAPMVHFLSPPVPFPPSRSRKTDFLMTPARRATCASHGGVQVRFMVMDRVSTTLNNVVRETYASGHQLPVSYCIHAVALLIDRIAKMHKQGLIHGDIHWGNVGLVPDGDGQTVRLGPAGGRLHAQRPRFRGLLHVPRDRCGWHALAQARHLLVRHPRRLWRPHRQPPDRTRNPAQGADAPCQRSRHFAQR